MVWSNQARSVTYDLQHLFDLPPEIASQIDMKQVCGYDPCQGAKVIEPFHVQGTVFFFAQTPRHDEL